MRRTGKAIGTLAGATAVAMLAGGVAFADDVVNNIDNSTDAAYEVMNLRTNGTAGTTQIRIEATADGSGGNADNGACNVSAADPLYISVTSNAPGVATAGPSTLTFTECGVAGAKTVTVTPGATAGDASITFRKATGNNNNKSFNFDPANFTARVTAPTPTKSNQTPLVVVAPSSGTYGENYSLSTTGGSGTGAVTYAAQGDACAVTATVLSIIRGTGSCSVTATKAADDNFNVATSAAQSVSPVAKALTGSFTAADKTYDGGLAAGASARNLSGVINGDTLTLNGGTASFANKNVGTAKAVTLTGATLSGTDAGNYSLTSVSPSQADINPLSVAGAFTASSREYDRTTNATVTGHSVPGKIAGDTLELTGGTATFADKNVGTGKAVSLTGASLNGTDAGNYTLTGVGNTTANITAKALTGSFTAADKTYDGTTSATVTGRSLATVLDEDEVTLDGGTASFSTATVGANKIVSLVGASLGGADASNYSLGSVTTNTASITAWDKVGFKSPVSMDSRKVNQLKAGSTVPLKFNVYAGQTEKTTSDAVSGTVSMTAPCDATDEANTVAAESTSSASLRYDTVGGQWVFNWKAPSTAGCYKVGVRLADGSSIVTDFKVTK